MLQNFDYFCNVASDTGDFNLFLNKSIFGGIADIIWWADYNFGINISTDTFPEECQVNISVSLGTSDQFEIHTEYKILSQTFKIFISEKPQKPVTIILKHNAIITTEEEAKSLVILYESDEGKKDILYNHTESKSSFITFELTEFSSVEVTVAGPNNITTNYLLSFYRQKISDNSNPYLEILALISILEPRHIHEVFHPMDISL